MSLLQQDSSGLDDAARGESFTKGTSHLIWASIVAAVLVTIAVLTYVIAGQKPPACVGEVTSATVHFRHQETSGLDAAGAPMPKEEFDQALLFTHIKLHNRSKDPLFLRQIMANLTLEDGIHTSYAAVPGDYERVFVAYPELGALHGKPLSLDSTIAAGATLEGDFVASFRMSKQQWDARKSLDYSASFRYQPEFKIALKAPVAVE